MNDPHARTERAHLRPRGSSQGGLRQYNERVVLQAIRLHGALPGAEIARLTGLTAQTVSMITPSRSSRQTAPWIACAMAVAALSTQASVTVRQGACNAAGPSKPASGSPASRQACSRACSDATLSSCGAGPPASGRPSGIEPIAPALPVRPLRRWLSITRPPPMKVSTKM